MGVPKGEKKESITGKVLKEVTTENFLNLAKSTNLNIQEPELDKGKPKEFHTNIHHNCTSKK